MQRIIVNQGLSHNLETGETRRRDTNRPEKEVKNFLRKLININNNQKEYLGKNIL